MEENLILEGLLSMVTEGASLHGHGTEGEAGSAGNASQSGRNARKAGCHRTDIVGVTQEPGDSRKRVTGSPKPT